MLYCLWSNIDLPTFFFFFLLNSREDKLFRGQERIKVSSIVLMWINILTQACHPVLSANSEVGFYGLDQLQSLMGMQCLIKSPRVLTLCVFTADGNSSTILMVDELHEDRL